MATQIATNSVPVEPLHPVERDTIPKIFFGAIDRFNRDEALRYKDGGIWRGLSHREVEERVRHLAAALQEMGVERDDRVALLSENRPEWAIADFAVTALRAADVPIYPTLPPNQIAYILRDCGAKTILVSTREQLDKILEIRGDLPDLGFVISFDDPGGAADVLHLSEVYERGRAAIEDGRADDLRERAADVRRDDLATLIYTSGTTGNPKGVMLTHYNLASNVAAALQTGVPDGGADDGALPFLPLCHSFERMVDYVYWDAGVTIAYAESIDKVADNLLEVRPTVAVSVPRLFEKIYTKVMGATGLKKRLLMWAKGVGEATVEDRLAGRQPNGGFAFKLADRLVFSKLRERTGGRIRFFVSGGAPLSAEIARFFWAAGLPIYEGYGLTESSPVLNVNVPGKAAPGTVGPPVPGTEMRIGDSGEILARGPQIMKGYWNNDEATAEALDAAGWLHTGDVGEFDAQGRLRITDRIKNLIVTAGGKNIAPQPIENAAAMSPYVAQVVMIGDKRAYPTLLVVPDFENLETWAKEQGLDTSSRATLAADPRVQELLERETVGRLDSFARYEQPKKISVVPDEFTIENGTLTPTMKIKRRIVEDRYRANIEELYA